MHLFCEVVLHARLQIKTRKKEDKAIHSSHTTLCCNPTCPHAIFPTGPISKRRVRASAGEEGLEPLRGVNASFAYLVPCVSVCGWGGAWQGGRTERGFFLLSHHYGRVRHHYGRSVCPGTCRVCLFFGMDAFLQTPFPPSLLHILSLSTRMTCGCLNPLVALRSHLSPHRHH